MEERNFASNLPHSKTFFPARSKVPKNGVSILGRATNTQENIAPLFSCFARLRAFFHFFFKRNLNEKLLVT